MAKLGMFITTASFLCLALTACAGGGKAALDAGGDMMSDGDAAHGDQQEWDAADISALDSGTLDSDAADTPDDGTPDGNVVDGDASDGSTEQAQGVGPQFTGFSAAGGLMVSESLRLRFSLAPYRLTPGTVSSNGAFRLVWTISPVVE